MELMKILPFLEHLVSLVGGNERERPGQRCRVFYRLLYCYLCRTRTFDRISGKSTACSRICRRINNHQHQPVWRSWRTRVSAECAHAPRGLLKISSLSLLNYQSESVGCGCIDLKGATLYAYSIDYYYSFPILLYTYIYIAVYGGVTDIVSGWELDGYVISMCVLVRRCRRRKKGLCDGGKGGS